MRKITKVLSIAGSDSSSGAGIQADIKTIHSLGGYCSSAITCITSQNSKKVFKVFNISKKIIISQIRAIENDIGFDSIKIGLLPNIEIADTIANFLKGKKIPIVIDPVYKASVGKEFISKKQYKECQELFYNISCLITPNIEEFEILCGTQIKSLAEMELTLKKFTKITKQKILLKGGDIKSNKCIDFLYNGKKVSKFSSKKIKTKNTHGTGCTLSSAIAFFLGRGFGLNKSVMMAKKYLIKAIKNAPKLNLEYGPLGH